MLSWRWYTAATGGSRTRDLAIVKSGTVPLGHRVQPIRYFNVILTVIALLPDCQCVQIFRLSLDVNCCIINVLLLSLLQ